LLRLPLPQLGLLPPVRTVVSWTATHAFHATGPLVVIGSGSGDKTYDWVQAFCFLLLAVMGTAAWSAIDWRRLDYATLHGWFHTFARLALGSTLIQYGMSKVIPLQMPQPGLLRLIEPYGDFSPMGVLWYSIGASRPYEIFAGCVELAGGVLLFVPGTALLGGLLSLATTTHIFALNMTYDVPVKLFSFHLIMLSLFVIAPDARRLADVVLFANRNVGPSDVPIIRHGGRRTWISIGLQMLVGFYVVGMNVYQGINGWYRYGGGVPRPPLYGIWNVDEMIRDGQTLPPLLTDQGRWRRVVIQTANNVTFQFMNDRLATLGSVVDLPGHALTLKAGSGDSPKARFVVDQPAPDQLVLDGTMDGHQLHARMTLFDRSRFLLVSRGFNWVQEYPFNR
jgi:hypothetical protein